MPSRMIFIVRKGKSPIIKHLHLYNPPTSAPKTSPFTTILNAMKIINWFIKGREQEWRLGPEALKTSHIGPVTLRNPCLLVKLRMKKMQRLNF